MKTITTWLITFILLTSPALSDTIYLQNGMRIDVSKVWEEDNQVKYEMYGTTFSYPKNEVKKIVKGELPEDDTTTDLDESLIKISPALSKQKDSISNVSVDKTKKGIEIHGTADTKKSIKIFVENVQRLNPSYAFKILSDKYIDIGERNFNLLATSNPKHAKKYHTSKTSNAKKQKSQNTNVKEYSGFGDDVITINKPSEKMPALLYVVGNSTKRHFAIKGYDANGKMTGVFVNTTKNYNGIVPIDLGNRNNTKTLEITSKGKWNIKVYPIGSARKISIPGTTTGSGDDVVILKGKAKLTKIEGNNSNRHFAVKSYNEYGKLTKILVNTTKKYNGKVVIPRNTFLLEIKAIGDWKIELI